MAETGPTSGGIGTPGAGVVVEGSEAPASRAVDGVIDRTLLCGTCGYDLKGLWSSGVCPECGTSVSASLRSYSLRYASAEYLGSLSRGIVSVEVAAALRVAAYVGLGLLGGWLFGNKGAAILREVVSGAIAVVFVLGWWWLTVPDLRRTTRESLLSPRRMARGAAIALGVGWIVSGLGNIARAQGVAYPVLLSSLGKVFWLLAIVVQFFAEVDYLAMLSKKGDDQRAHDWATTCRWLIPIGIVALVIGGVVLYFSLLESVRGVFSRESGRRRDAEVVRIRVE